MWGGATEVGKRTPERGEGATMRRERARPFAEGRRGGLPDGGRMGRVLNLRRLDSPRIHTCECALCDPTIKGRYFSLKSSYLTSILTLKQIS